jgi:hypothetical protein
MRPANAGSEPLCRDLRDPFPGAADLLYAMRRKPPSLHMARSQAKARLSLPPALTKSKAFANKYRCIGRHEENINRGMRGSRRGRVRKALPGPTMWLREPHRFDRQ